VAEYLVVEGATLTADIPGDSTATISVSGEFAAPPEEASILSDNVRADGSRVYKRIGFSITGAAVGGCSQSATFYGSINPNPAGGQKVMVDGGEKPVRANDETPVMISGTTGSSVCTISGTVKIDDPGQDKVKAE
jgi:hypothetical protein